MQVCLSIYDLFLPGMKRKQNLLGNCEVDLENLKKCGKIANEQFLLHLLIYLRTLFYVGIKSHTFKMND